MKIFSYQGYNVSFHTQQMRFHKRKQFGLSDTKHAQSETWKEWTMLILYFTGWNPVVWLIKCSIVADLISLCVYWSSSASYNIFPSRTQSLPGQMTLCDYGKRFLLKSGWLTIKMTTLHCNAWKNVPSQCWLSKKDSGKRKGKTGEWLGRRDTM